MWLENLNDVIRSALSYSEVAHRLWSSPCNKVCADCGAANPEWASVNLLVVICEACAGAHRSMGSNRSKVRGLKLDNKVWTEPLIQVRFVMLQQQSASSCQHVFMTLYDRFYFLLISQCSEKLFLPIPPCRNPLNFVILGGFLAYTTHFSFPYSISVGL